MPSADISIIIPAYNAEAYIAETIESVQQQEFQNWELIVTDDGSTDRTGDIIRNLANTDMRILYLKQENGGIGKARNYAISHSTAPLLAFIDADDLWYPAKLKLQMKAMQETGCDLVFTSGHIIRNTADNIESYWQRPSGLLGYESIFEKQLYGFTVPLLSVLVKKEVVLGSGGFEESKLAHLAADYQMWLKIMDKRALFFGIDEPLFQYRRHDGQSTAQDNLALDQVLWSLKFANLSSISGQTKLNVMKQRLNRFLVHQADVLPANVMRKYIDLYDSILNKPSMKWGMRFIYRLGPDWFKKFGYRFLDLSENYKNI